MAMRIAIVYGTRPECVKLAPVVQELRQWGVKPTIIATGQHTDLLRGTPAETVMAPDVSLQMLGAFDPIGYAGRLQMVLTEELRVNKPDLCMVQGDTASAYAGAMAGRGQSLRGFRRGRFGPRPESSAFMNDMLFSL